jgi:hypothetical protein
MAFTEDLSVFLADLGISVTAGAVSGLGILDMPGESIMGDMVITTNYMLTCRSDQFGTVGYGASITVAATAYKVQENLPIGDGRFCRLHLEKV